MRSRNTARKWEITVLTAASKKALLQNQVASDINYCTKQLHLIVGYLSWLWAIPSVFVQDIDPFRVNDKM